MTAETAQEGPPAQRRVGLIVPSSNTTMETELPVLLGRFGLQHGMDFTFHASRARLHKVDKASLARMVDDSERCAAEVTDAHVDVVAYACLVAVMAQGVGAHEEVEARLSRLVHDGSSRPVQVTSSAGALVRTLHDLGLRRVAVVAPYMPPLTALVVEYLQHAGIEVVDAQSLSVEDNYEVGRLDVKRLPDHVSRLDLSSADGIVLSACVQMPSLAAVQAVEDVFGLPVVTAATATTREVLQALDLPAEVDGGGAALRRLTAPTMTAAAR